MNSNPAAVQNKTVSILDKRGFLTVSLSWPMWSLMLSVINNILCVMKTLRMRQFRLLTHYGRCVLSALFCSLATLLLLLWIYDMNQWMIGCWAWWHNTSCAGAGCCSVVKRPGTVPFITRRCWIVSLATANKSTSPSQPTSTYAQSHSLLSSLSLVSKEVSKA